MDSDSAPPTPVTCTKKQGKRVRQKKAKRDAAELFKELRNFKEAVTKALAGPASDDEDTSRVKMGHFKRTLRVAVREGKKKT
jgi:hypothetical protein